MQVMELKLTLLYSRFAKYYQDSEGIEYRMLIKAYGIRFVVMVNGKVRFQGGIFLSLDRKKVGDMSWWEGSSGMRTAFLACRRKGLLPFIHVELTLHKKGDEPASLLPKTRLV